MMDMGFWPDVRRIVEALPREKRQTLLFSATMPDEVMKLAAEFLRDAEVHRAWPRRRPGPDHHAHGRGGRVARKSRSGCARFLKKADGPTLVFVRTKHGADRLARQLSALGVRAAALHGDRSQEQRMAGGRRVPERPAQGARRDRHRRARPRHRRHHARRELRSAVHARGLRAPRGPHGPKLDGRDSADAGRAGRSARAARTGEIGWRPTSVAIRISRSGSRRRSRRRARMAPARTAAAARWTPRSRPRR